MSLEVVSSLGSIPSEVDLVVALGKNLGVEWDRERLINRSRDYLSTDSRISALALGEILLNRPDIEGMFSGGRTLGPDYSPQPVYARRYLSTRYPKVEIGRILLDPYGYDTAASAESLASMIASGKIKQTKIALMSVGYHVVNSAQLFENWGVKLSAVIASEDIVAEKNEHFAAYVEGWKKSGRIKAEVSREKKRALLLKVDKKGYVPRVKTVTRLRKTKSSNKRRP